MPAFSDIDCGDPGTPTNGHRHNFSTVYTSEVLYKCHLGYTILGSDRRTCQSNGEWSGHLPQCNRMFLQLVQRRRLDCILYCDGASSSSQIEFRE